MAWTLSHHPLKEPGLLDEFLLSAGKALCIASAFESKCKYVIRVVQISECYRETSDASAAWDLAQILKDQLLGKTIKKMRNYPTIDQEDIKTLEAAKDARNYIAHECADLGELSRVSSRLIQERISSLRGHLGALIKGDNLISRWVYEIEEKEPAPQQIQEIYPVWVHHWVFPSDRT